MTSQLVLDGDFDGDEIVGLERGRVSLLAPLGHFQPRYYLKDAINPREPLPLSPHTDFFTKASDPSSLKTQAGRVQGTRSGKGQNVGLVRD